jgi:exosortase A-associated hydrolase 1
MAVHEEAVVFHCARQELLGILHWPEGHVRTLGIVIVVGGPQYRVGSHRQFVLMARLLAQAGYPVFRFDYRGMGDSAGEPRSFEAVGEDIRAAIDTLDSMSPGLSGICVWGLCDAASAALLYCRSDPRVKALVLANPWVRTVAGEAQAYLKHYYLRRLLQRSFWRNVLAGGFHPLRSLRDLTGKLLAARRTSAAVPAESYVTRMRNGLESFAGAVLLLISERDLTARAFTDLCASDARWHAAVASPRVTTVPLEGADHTFSGSAALLAATQTCVSWLTRQEPVASKSGSSSAA